MNITRAETQHANLHILRQIVTLDQTYQAKFEHIAGTANTGAHSLSRLQMLDAIPDTLLQEVYAINELDCDTNLDFPLDMHRIREEQELDGKLQALVKAKHRDVSTTTFGTTKVYTVKGKVWVPLTLQPRIIE